MDQILRGDPEVTGVFLATDNEKAQRHRRRGLGERVVNRLKTIAASFGTGKG